MSIKVAYIFDSNFLRQGVASIRSLASSHIDKSLDIYIYDGGGLQDNEILSNSLADLANCNFVISPLPLDQVKNVHHMGFSHNTWGRMLLPELLPNLEKVIYLDADTIIQKSLTDLWDVTLDNYYVAAVDDYLESRSNRKITKHKVKIGITPEQTYFNAGVLLMNLQKLRKIDFSNKSFVLGKELEKVLVYPDQDVMNIMLGAKRYSLPLEWNYQTTFFREEIPFKKIKVIHYTSSEKPWFCISASSLKSCYLHWTTPHISKNIGLRVLEIGWYWIRKKVKCLLLKKYGIL